MMTKLEICDIKMKKDQLFLKRKKQTLYVIKRGLRQK